MNDVIAQMRARKSVRAFLDKPIEPEKKQLILESIFQAPTAGNQMLYTVIDITDEALKQTLARTCDNQPFIAKAPLVLVFVSDCQRWLDAYKVAGCDPRRPGVGDLMLAVTDTAIAAQNAVSAAWSMGIGSCYIGDIMENCEEHRRLLNLPDYGVPTVMLAFGYPTEQQEERPKPARFDAHYIVHENAYRRLGDEEHRQMHELRKPEMDYDREIAAFCKRKYHSDFAREMTRSIEKYLENFNMQPKE